MRRRIPDSDRLFGGNDDDKLIGGHGRDLLVGGAGADVLSGFDGTGAGDGATDIFDFNLLTESDSTSHDLIVDFEQQIDKIDLSDLSTQGISGIADIAISDDGTNTYIKGVNVDFLVELSGVYALGASDFIF